MSFLKELFEFIIVRKKYWLVPILFFLVFLGAIIILGKGSALSPFIYTIF